ncbi:peptidase family M48-domain-containing protein [Kockovaella imperatae]|uniref:Peptidase family M48-domain-containing protein n=1 Tax=Kockovaella imperatae TaxID=4999 RepID=A0A1Y1URF2_9TREE|nr:peptidase family M48-domain-containing protein [Kockovaella imperatae]ORX40643.1 peptidase family M48-domain-containing protein [Kockovaella imperatae]
MKGTVRLSYLAGLRGSRPPARAALTPLRPHTVVLPLRLIPFPSSPLQLNPHFVRQFHPSRRRNDVFFVAFPALKSGLLNVTRITLLFLPFVFRYRLWRRYRKTSFLLIQIPIFALCVVFALGLDQSPRTGRWRLLLMSENEELAWSRRKRHDILKSDGEVLLSPSDPMCEKVGRVTARLITALEEQEHHYVCGAAWPPRSSDSGHLVSEREAWERKTIEDRYKPSGTATSSFMPFRPDTSNPLKKLQSADWNLYVLDLPMLQAFALPSKDIFVYTGLLKTLPDDDAMLAAVLAHEIAHVAERHSVENLGFLNVAAVGFDVLRGISFALTISFPFITDSAGLFINWLNDIVAQRAYSRKLEIEADAFGLDLMATAGYDPRAALDLWDLMRAVEEDMEMAGQKTTMENRFALLRTHPTSDDRQKALQKDLDGAMKLWRERLPKLRAKVQVTAELPTDEGKAVPPSSTTSIEQS